MNTPKISDVTREYGCEYRLIKFQMHVTVRLPMLQSSLADEVEITNVRQFNKPT